MKTVDIRVIQRPITVELDCPYCDVILEWSYEDFIGVEIEEHYYNIAIDRIKGIK